MGSINSLFITLEYICESCILSSREKNKLVKLDFILDFFFYII